MSGTAGELKYRIGVDLGDLKDAVEGALGNVAKQAAGLVLGLEALQGAFEGLTDFVGGSIDAAAEADQAFADLTAAFARAGVDGAQAAAEDFAQYATNLQNITGLSDEAIQKAGMIGASFGVTGDRLKTATTAAADMSKVMGMDLNSAMSLIVRSAESGKNALARYGIEMSKGGTEAERLQQLLDGISARFGGAAAVAAQTYAGRLAILSESWGDTKEEIGKVITQSPTINAALEVGAKLVQQLTGWVAQNRGAMEQWAAKGFEYVVSGAYLLVDALEIGGKSFYAFQAVGDLALSTIVSGFNGLLEVTGNTLSVFADLLNAIPGDAGALGDGINAALDGIANLQDAADGTQEDLYGQADAALEGFGTVHEAAETARGKIAQVGQAVTDTASKIATQIPGATVVAKAAIEDEEMSIDDAIEKMMAMNQKWADDHAAKAKQAAQAAAQAMLEAEMQIGQAMGNAMGQMVTGATTAEQAWKTVLGTVLDVVQDVVMNAIKAYALQTTASVAASTTQATAATAAAATTAAVTTASATTAIVANAASAATGAASSQASIPYIGPILAVAAAGAMFAFVRSYLTKFHDGGIVGGARREVPALLLRDEEVLTRNDPRHAMNGGGKPSLVVYQSFSSTLPPDTIETRRAARELERHAQVMRERMGMAQ